MINKEAIQKDVKRGIKDGTIKTEEDAMNVAKKYISEDEPSYEPCLQVAWILPRTPKDILHKSKYKHSWFKGKVETIIFIDIWGRMWSRSKGVIKEDVKTRKSEVFGYCIDKLGGMMWSSKKGRTYICEYRTSEEEIKNTVNPETFIG